MPTECDTARLRRCVLSSRKRVAVALIYASMKRTALIRSSIDSQYFAFASVASSHILSFEGPRVPVGGCSTSRFDL